MANLCSLTVAIEEIISAPYPVALTHLWRLLQHDSHLHAWSQNKPCQIKPLISVLIHRSKYDSGALPCLASLLRCEDVRHRAVRVTSSEEVDGLCQRLCQQIEGKLAGNLELLISLALFLLESSRPRPRMLMDTIDITLNKLSNCPENVWIDEICFFLTNAPFTCISDLHDDSISVLVDRWKRSLRSEDHRHAVVAVHIAYRLAEHAGAQAMLLASTATTSDLTGKCLQNWLDRACCLFESPKIDHVLDTLMLVVLKASSDELPDLDTVRRCKLVICGLEQARLARWYCRNVDLVAKLIGKCLRPMLIDLQIFVFEIMDAMLPTGVNSHFSLADTILTRLVQDQELGIMPFSSHNLSKSLVRVLINAAETGHVGTQDHVQDCFQLVICWILAQSSPSTEFHRRTLCNVEVAIFLCESLLKEIGTRPNRAQHIVETILKADVARSWYSNNLTGNRDMPNCVSLPVCCHRIDECRQQLRSRLALLLLRASSTSCIALDDDVFQRVGDCLAEFGPCISIPPCKYPGPRAVGRSTIRSRDALISTDDWRVGLSGFFADMLGQTRDQVESVIHELCRDLQDRCDNAEVPLRKAENEISMLLLKLDKAQAETDASRKEKDRLNRMLEKAETEHRHCLEVANTSMNSLAHANRRLDDMKQEISSIKEAANCAQEDHRREIAELSLSAEQNEATMRQLHEAAIFDLEDQLRTRSQTEAGLESQVGWLKEEIDRLRAEMLASNKASLEALEVIHQDECAKLRGQVEVLRQDIGLRENEISRITQNLAKEVESNDHVSKAMAELNDRLSNASSNIRARDCEIAALQEALDQIRGERAILERQQAEGEAKQADLEARTRELEHNYATLEKQSRIQSRALDKAREAERRVLAILQGQRHASSPSSPNASTITPTSDQKVIQRLSGLSLSFLSEAGVGRSGLLDMG